MTELQPQPAGDLLLRTMAMPADTNANGDIFGGWIMSQMDIGGGILAKEIAAGRVVTVAVDGMTFHRPVKVGHVVCCYGKCTRIGNTSLSIKLEVWVKPVLAESGEDRYCVTEGLFTYVSVDQGKRATGRLLTVGLTWREFRLNSPGDPHEVACFRSG